jgi:hypothetical protein
LGHPWDGVTHAVPVSGRMVAARLMADRFGSPASISKHVMA